jgi:hypothetical protein
MCKSPQRTMSLHLINNHTLDDDVFSTSVDKMTRPMPIAQATGPFGFMSSIYLQ